MSKAAAKENVVAGVHGGGGVADDKDGGTGTPKTQAYKICGKDWDRIDGGTFTYQDPTTCAQVIDDVVASKKWLNKYRDAVSIYSKNRGDDLEATAFVKDCLPSSNASMILRVPLEESKLLDEISGGGGGVGAAAGWSEWEDCTWKQILIEGKSEIRILAVDLQGTGLDKDCSEPGDEVLYRRQEVDRLFAFLQKQVIQERCTGWVLGSPGTGKSTTAFAWAFSLRRDEWNTTWIHLEKAGRVSCLQIRGNQKRKLGILEGDRQGVVKLISNIKADAKKELLILDGIVYDSEWHHFVYGLCSDWLLDHLLHHRLVVVGSTASRYKSSQLRDLRMKIREHMVLSWIEADACSAVEHNSIFQMVADFLDANMDLELTEAAKDVRDMAKAITARKELVRAKFYFAGGCARNLFGSTTSDVATAYSCAVEALSNKVMVIDNIMGFRSNQTINRLFAIVGRSKVSIISPFAATQIGLGLKAGMIERFLQIMGPDLNPAMDRWLLEMHFFALLGHGGVKLKNRRGDEINWNESTADSFDPLSDTVIDSQDPFLWLKPLKWNQGGYDAVHIDRGRKTVRFVQVTRGLTHDLKLRFFSELTTKLESEIGIEKVEICFVVPMAKLEGFSVGKISHENSLTKFGISSGQISEKIQILGMTESWSDRWTAPPTGLALAPDPSSGAARKRLRTGKGPGAPKVHRPSRGHRGSGGVRGRRGRS